MMKLSEKQIKAVEKIKKIHPDNEFFWDEETRNPKFIKGRLSEPSAEKPDAIARKFVENSKDLLDMQKGLEEKLEFSHEETDNQGFHHVYFRQILQGIPVFEGSTQVHINPEGEVVAYKDYRLSKIDVQLKPKIIEKSAAETALKDLSKGTKNIKTSAYLMLFRDSEKKQHLVWEVECLVSGELGARYWFVDAHSGRILYKFAQIRRALSRMTYTAKNKEVLPGEIVIKDSQKTTDNVAQSAHDHAETVYKYYKNTFGRDSYDNTGSKLVSTVHFGQSYNNADWSDYYRQMVYGDGDGMEWKPLAYALDVVGHELTHAVTSGTARFVYAEEAGALDESFADFFGLMVSNDDPITDWEMGEGVFTPQKSGDALRDLSDPTKYDQPDHMDDYGHLAPGELPDDEKNDNGYVHFNSGIPNKVAYLIIDGGTHHGIAVKGVGRKKAEQIYYMALTQYLSSSTPSRWTFKQARFALLNACRQLYGDTGTEYAAIKNAWASVGVEEPADDAGLIQKEVMPNILIPDNNPAGISSIINVPEQGLLKDISASVKINHTYTGDLRIILASPSGESVVLHDRSGGSSKNIDKTYDLNTSPALRTYIGDQIKGDWVLQVTDNARADKGNLVKWGLRLSAQKAEKTTFKKEVSPNMQIRDNDSAGIESLIKVDTSGKIVNLDISVYITHTWIGDLRVVLLSPSGDNVTLHNRTGKNGKDIKKTYSTKSDASLKSVIGKDIRGDWRLKVMDLASEDTGVLKRWGIEVIYE